MFKVVTLYKRKPGMEVDAFQSRWLDKHSLIASRTPGLAPLCSVACFAAGIQKRRS